jgi:hypothetical protein
VTTTALERVYAPGVYRWRATWSDSNFDNAARALSVERFIIQARPDAVIEVSFNGFVAGEAIGTALATVELRGKTDCQFPDRAR